MQFDLKSSSDNCNRGITEKNYSTQKPRPFSAWPKMELSGRIFIKEIGSEFSLRSPFEALETLLRFRFETFGQKTKNFFRSTENVSINLNELFKVFREKIRKIFEAQTEFGSLTKTGKSEFLNEKSSPGGVFMSLSYPYLRLPFVTVSMHFVACQVQLSQHILLLFTFCCMNRMHRSILDWTPPKCMFTVSIHPMQGL